MELKTYPRRSRRIVRPNTVPVTKTVASKHLHQSVDRPVSHMCRRSCLKGKATCKQTVHPTPPIYFIIQVMLSQ